MADGQCWLPIVLDPVDGERQWREATKRAAGKATDIRELRRTSDDTEGTREPPAQYTRSSDSGNAWPAIARL